MNTDDYKYLCGFLKGESGLTLNEDKLYLVESRLVPVARKHGFGELEELVNAIRTKRDAALNKEVVEAMTTNESFFFRDIKPFEIFKDTVLPVLAAARRKSGQRKIRIWSAACSSGQEPYTISMVLKENPSLFQGIDVEIVATDLSTDILEKAKGGYYTQFEAQRGMPIQLLMKYFTQEDEQWRINEDIRKMVSYRPFNLLDDLFSLGKFDVVFCRNVLIYFDPETKGQVLDRICKQMPDDGFLFLGGAETVIGISESFNPVQGQRGLYGVSDQAPRVGLSSTPISKTA